jgi:hypothetical protein
MFVSLADGRCSCASRPRASAGPTWVSNKAGLRRIIRSLLVTRAPASWNASDQAWRALRSAIM